MIIVLARRSSPSRSSLLFSRPKVTDSFILDSLFPPLLELLFGLLLVFTVNRPLCNCRGQGGIDNYKLLRLSGRLFFFRLYFYLLFSSLFAFRKDRANRSIFLPFPSFDRESRDFYSYRIYAKKCFLDVGSSSRGFLRMKMSGGRFRAITREISRS